MTVPKTGYNKKKLKQRNTEITTMVKINLPSEFEPQLTSDKQQDLRQEIADRALDINFYKTTIDRTGHYDEWRRATNNIC